MLAVLARPMKVEWNSRPYLGVLPRVLSALQSVSQTHKHEASGPEESLLGAEDLHGGGGVLGQVGQAAGVGDESRADLCQLSSDMHGCKSHLLANECGQVGRDVVHLGLQVGEEALSVLQGM